MAMKGYLEPLVTEMICDDPFDSIDDLLDFPNEDDGLGMAEAWGNSAHLAPAPAQAIISAGSGDGAGVGGVTGGQDGREAAVSGDVISSENDALGLYNEIDVANLEWLSNFFEDSEINLDFIPTSPPDPKINHKNPNSLSRSSSPVSVLHTTTPTAGAVTYTCSTCSSSSSSSSIYDTSHATMSPPPPPIINLVPARARTKRPRVPSSSARTFIHPSSSAVEPCHVAIKKVKKDAESAPSSSVRRCTHCEVQKTPQWRAGPMGPKTLCNACGVRYKSGRLFPEYRPAVSPTFVSAVHSNSHRKVVEMRLRGMETAGKNGRGQTQEGTVAAKNCDLVEYIRRRD